MPNANAIKQISYAAAGLAGNADTFGANRVGFAVGFSIGTTGGGPTVNMQADLAWDIYGSSHAEARYLPIGPAGGIAGAADGFPPEVSAGIANFGGGGIRSTQFVWSGPGTHAEVPLLPFVVNKQDANPFGSGTVTWTTAMNAGQLYAFYARLLTAAHASALGTGAVTQGKVDFTFGNQAAAVITIPPQLRTPRITLTILDPQYFWETCNII